MSQSENRSCPEFLNIEPGLICNCPNCKRWLASKHKCREEIWVKEWVSYLLEGSLW